MLKHLLLETSQHFFNASRIVQRSTTALKPETSAYQNPSSAIRRLKGLSARTCFNELQTLVVAGAHQEQSLTLDQRDAATLHNRQPPDSTLHYWTHNVCCRSPWPIKTYKRGQKDEAPVTPQERGYQVNGLEWPCGTFSQKRGAPAPCADRAHLTRDSRHECHCLLQANGNKPILDKNPVLAQDTGARLLQTPAICFRYS